MSSVSVSCFIHYGPKTSDNGTLLFLQLRIVRGRIVTKVVGFLSPTAYELAIKRKRYKLLQYDAITKYSYYFKCTMVPVVMAEMVILS